MYYFVSTSLWNRCSGIWKRSNISFSRRCLGEIEHSAYSSIELADVDFSAPVLNSRCGSMRTQRRMWIVRMLLYRFCVADHYSEAINERKPYLIGLFIISLSELQATAVCGAVQFVFWTKQLANDVPLLTFPL